MEYVDELFAEMPVSESVVSYNLAFMKGEMREFLGNESMGGNAQSMKVKGIQCPCVAANGVIDATTGKIERFSNHEFSRGQLFTEGKAGQSEFFFQIAYVGDSERIIYWSNPLIIQEGARKAIEECICRWNREQELLYGSLEESVFKVNDLS